MTSIGYWSLTEAERASLTEEQMKSFTSYALMEAGVLSPVAPPTFDETGPALERRTLYVPKDSRTYGNKLRIGFTTPEQAAAFLALKPIVLEHQYVGHEYIDYSKPIEDLTFEASQVCTESAINTAKASIERYNANKAANQKARSEYDEAVKKANQVTDGIWDDYRDCQAKARELVRIREQYAEYVKMCDGNEGAARRFLVKAYTVDKVEAAIGVEEVAEPAEVSG